MKKEIFYIPNLISMSRFILLGITIYYLVNDNFLMTCIFIVLIWFSDLLDGYWARSRDQITEFGKIIDPLADKVSVVSLVIILLIKGIIPMWYVIITVLRDAIILVGGLYLSSKKNIVLQSNWTGKLAVFTIGAAIFFAIIANGAKFGQFGSYLSYHSEITELLYTVMLFSSVVLAIISLVSYFNRFIENK
ncbi:MAG: CDP-alcohol phosphatidyltransferase family protein [Ignavibacteria bacterium]